MENKKWKSRKGKPKHREKELDWNGKCERLNIYVPSECVYGLIITQPNHNLCVKVENLARFCCWWWWWWKFDLFFIYLNYVHVHGNKSNKQTIEAKRTAQVRTTSIEEVDNAPGRAPRNSLFALNLYLSVGGVWVYVCTFKWVKECARQSRMSER